VLVMASGGDARGRRHSRREAGAADGGTPGPSTPVIARQGASQDAQQWGAEGAYSAGLPFPA